MILSVLFDTLISTGSLHHFYSSLLFYTDNLRDSKYSTSYWPYTRPRLTWYIKAIAFSAKGC